MELSTENLYHIHSLKRVLQPDCFDKIRIQEVFQRSTYADFFEYANTHLAGETCVLCNNDMSFDETLEKIENTEDFDLEGYFLCLTRWDLMLDNSLKFKQPARIRKNSHDAWIFKSPIPVKMVEKGGFYMGRPGCDGMVAYLASISGLRAFNPSEVITAKHFHISRHRSYSRKHRMGGNDIYMCVYPTSQMKFDPQKLMYKFGKPIKEVYGQEAMDTAIQLEKSNDIHWNYALEKCRKF